jgi:hypothetical protein
MGWYAPLRLRALSEVRKPRSETCQHEEHERHPVLQEREIEESQREELCGGGGDRDRIHPDIGVASAQQPTQTASEANTRLRNAIKPRTPRSASISR